MDESRVLIDYRYFSTENAMHANIYGYSFIIIKPIDIDVGSGTELVKYVLEKGETFKKAMMNWLSYLKCVSSFEGDYILDQSSKVKVKGSYLTAQEMTILTSYLYTKSVDDKPVDVLSFDEFNGSCGFSVQEEVIPDPKVYEEEDVSHDESCLATICSAINVRGNKDLCVGNFDGKIISSVKDTIPHFKEVNVVWKNPDWRRYIYWPSVVLVSDGELDLERPAGQYITSEYVLYFWGVDFDYRLLPPRIKRYDDVWTEFFSPDHVYHVMDKRGEMLLRKHVYWGSNPVVSVDTKYSFDVRDVPRKKQICFLTDKMRDGHDFYLWLDLGRVVWRDVRKLKSNLVVPQGTLIDPGIFKYSGIDEVQDVDTGKVYIKALRSRQFSVFLGKRDGQSLAVTMRVIRPCHYKRVMRILQKSPGTDLRRYECV